MQGRRAGAILCNKGPLITMRPSGRALTLPRRGLLAALVVGTVAAPVAAARLQLPAIVAPASHEHLAGKVIFVELVTPDLALAKRFYGGLFGWTFRDIAAGRTAYVEAMLAGRPVAGMFQR
ncbi:MAG: hypothetical protein KGL52_00750 [Rhodospirillales bacterium]|nr:hypothetical protein [Rhodospirillales bacterium]